MSLLLFKAPEQVAPVPDSPAAVLSKTRSNETYTWAKQNPFAIFLARTPLPDPTIAKFGGGRGFNLYYEVRRQITELGGIMGQLVDAALKRRLVIVPGDPSNDLSVKIADETRRVWDNIAGKAVALRKAIDTLITCGFSPIELVWDRDPSTGIVAPIGAMRGDGTRGPGLIDRPAQNFISDLDGNMRFLTTLDPYVGEEIEPLKFIFLVAGSLNTAYGESQHSDLYSAAWLYQQVRQMMLDAVEKFGRPIPHVLIPRAMDPNDVAELDNFYTQKFGVYSRDLYDGPQVKIEYPSMNIASQGTAGKSEIEVLKFLQGTMYIHLLRTQQNQNQTTGTHSVESVRDARTDAAAATYSDILMEGMQAGWMLPVMRINYPSVDPQLWARFVQDTTATEDMDKVHRRLMEAVDRGVEISKEWYFKRTSAQEAKSVDDVLGHPKTTITASTDAPPVVPDPEAGDEPGSVSPGEIQGGE